MHRANVWEYVNDAKRTGIQTCGKSPSEYVSGATCSSESGRETRIRRWKEFRERNNEKRKKLSNISNPIKIETVYCIEHGQKSSEWRTRMEKKNRKIAIERFYLDVYSSYENAVWYVRRNVRSAEPTKPPSVWKPVSMSIEHWAFENIKREKVEGNWLNAQRSIKFTK